MNITRIGGNEDFEPDCFPDLVTDVWHNYATEPYEGSGWAILRYSDGRWDCINLGHCSCNGPLDDVRKEGVFASLDELVARHSKDAYGEFEAVVDAARRGSATITLRRDGAE